MTDPKPTALGQFFGISLVCANVFNIVLGIAGIIVAAIGLSRNDASQRWLLIVTEVVFSCTLIIFIGLLINIFFLQNTFKYEIEIIFGITILLACALCTSSILAQKRPPMTDHKLDKAIAGLLWTTLATVLLWIFISFIFFLDDRRLLGVLLYVPKTGSN